MKNTATHNIIFCSLFVTLIIVGAFIKIPLPPIPLTLQSLFVLLSGLILGKKLGPLSVLIYIFIGLLGLPIFAGGSGGIGSLMMPSFGFVIGFILASCICGLLADKPYLAVFLATASLYVCGTLYYTILQSFVLNETVDLTKLFVGSLVFSIPKDIVVCLISATISKKVKKII